MQAEFVVEITYTDPSGSKYLYGTFPDAQAADTWLDKQLTNPPTPISGRIVPLNLPV